MYKYTIIFLLLLNFKATSQNNNIIYKVIYGFFHLKEKTPNKITNINLELIFDSQRSIFQFYNYDSLNNEYEKKRDAVFRNGEKNLSYDLRGFKKIPQTQLYKDFSTSSIITKEKIIDDVFYSSESITKIEWVIKPEKKRIQNFECQLALCTYKGRSYQVWFTKQIPISNGPWKLQGLPGLILEAEDEKKEVRFTFISLEKSIIPKKYLEFDKKNKTQVTKSELNKIISLYEEDPISYYKNKMSTEGINIGIDTEPLKPKKTNKNKLELEK